MNVEDIKQLMDGFDPAALLPDLTTVAGKMELICRIAVMLGPILLLTLGLIYYFLAPKEANHRFGYRTYFGMGSEEAWCFVQRLAGFVYMILGGVLALAALIISIILIWQDTVTLLTTAAIYLAIEAVLTGLAVSAINIYMAGRYDQDGYRRGSR